MNKVPSISTDYRQPTDGTVSSTKVGGFPSVNWLWSLFLSNLIYISGLGKHMEG